MAVSSRSTLILPANYADNLCRWDQSRRGHFEVWFLTLNDLPTRRGFWFRYTLRSPLTGEQTASLWAAVFDPSSPHENFGITRQWPLSQASFHNADGFEVRVADSVFTPAAATGRIDNCDHRIEWDLKFQPAEKTFNHLTPAMNFLMRPSALVCAPNLDVSFSGTVSVDGRDSLIERAPGCQSHIWGRKQVDEWVWAHCNAFDRRPETVFESLSARARVAGMRMPPLQSLYLRHHGEEFHFLRPRLRQKWRNQFGIAVWSFSAMNSRMLIEGTAQCRLRDMIQAEYQDPDGQPLYCLNSEVANLKIRLFRRAHGVHYRYVETLKTRSTAHLEHASRTKDPLVVRMFNY
jgi:hypothetical protein